MAQADAPATIGDRSSSITAMLSVLGPDPVVAAHVAQHLLTTHPEYAGGRAASWPVDWQPSGRRRTAEVWVRDCESLLTSTPSPSTPAQTAPARRITTRTCLLGLGVLEPAVGRAMLRAGLTAALLDEYEPVSGHGLQPFAVVLQPSAAQLAASVPALAVALGLAVPARWDVSTVVRSRAPRATTADVTAIGWSVDGNPLVGLGDGGILSLDGRPWHVETGASAPRQVGADRGAWAVVNDSVVRTGLDGRGTTTAPLKPGVTLSVLGRATATIGALGPGSRPVVTVSSPDASRTVPVQGHSRPTACAVSDSGGTLLMAYDSGELSWYSEQAPLLGTPVTDVSGLRVGTQPTAVVTDSRGTLAAALDSEAVSVVQAPDLAPAGSSEAAEPRLLLRLRRGQADQRAVALSPDGAKLAVLVQASDGTQTVEVHDLRLALGRVRAAVENDLPPSDDAIAGSPDYVDVGTDVDALAMLLASRSLTPPLCLGLFGDWGAGKSWFMARLRSRVCSLSRDAKDSGRPQADVEYWKHVVAVDFNAWTFAEANLWASLMETLLQRLDRRRPVAGDAHLVGETLLRGSLDQAQTAAGAATALLGEARRAAVRARWRTVFWGALALVGAGLVTSGLLAQRPPAWIGGLAAWAAVAGLYLREWTNLRKKAESATGEATAIGRPFTEWWRLEVDRREKAQTVAAATTRVDQLEAAARDPRLLVGTYIEQRLAADDYRRHLGLVGLVRDDLSNLDKAVREANQAATSTPSDERIAGTQDDLVNRVVLFIDDLDRCPPSRVVEVLEAIHLLLAYELFVVVVAVDSRWVQQSLRSHYPRLLARERAGAATALDYVEKIVQLPFQLHPMTDNQVSDMISGLTGDLRPGATSGGATPAQGTLTTAGAPIAAEDGGNRLTVDRDLRAAGPAATARRDGQPTGAAQVAPSIPAAGAAPATAVAAVAADLRPEGLQVSSHERDYLASVAPLVGRTPRTVKRFVNTYRVLKARMPDPSVFAADTGRGADFRVAGLLLAVVVGLEDVAPAFFAALRDLSTDAPLRDAVDMDADDGSTIAAQRDCLRSWLDLHLADAPAGPYQEMAGAVARFSFASLPA